MSRLIVKNLPNSVTTERLRHIFSEKGEITDVQLKYTKEGKFRSFGFVGFKTEEQANQARDFFNGSCIKTTKISVETCTALGHTDKPKAWSKYAPDSSAYKRAHNVADNTTNLISDDKDKKLTKDERKKLREKEKNGKTRELLLKHKDDPLFSEFMEVHASKIKKAVWANDSVINKSKEGIHPNYEDEVLDADSQVEEEKSESDVEPVNVKGKKIKKIANEAITDLEYMKSLVKGESNGADVPEKEVANKHEGIKKDPKKKKEARNRVLYYVKIQGMPFSCKKKDVKEFFRPLVPFTIRIPRCSGKVTRGFCYIGFRTEEERKKAMFKSKSFLAGHRVIVNKYESNTNPVTEEETTAVSSFKRKMQEDSLKNEESIAESGRIYVRNLPYIITENDLQELFEKFGPVTEANLPVDKLTRQPKGFGHITFMMPEHAVKAFIELDGSVFCGRMLHLLPGKQKIAPDSNEEGLTYKEKKERKQKSQAGSAHNWNTLFLGANAIADVVANTYNTTKEKFLDGNAKTSAAVRLALGETQLVSSTKKFLQENGVCLDAFNQIAKKRSKNVILVKNMPAQSTYDEVLKVFEPFGLIARLVMPPHGITALVEFVEPSEARHAFSKLAYSKFKHLPLYLEWAPDNVFIQSAEQKESERDLSSKKEPATVSHHQKSKEAQENDITADLLCKTEEIHVWKDDDTPEPDTTLFVKGLHFDTREESLKEHFVGCGRVYSATVALKKDPSSPGQYLSMGYGFVQYFSKAAAERAIRELQLSSLDGKQIELKRSERTGRGDVKTAKKAVQMKKQTGTKILVRNVAFQANQREIQEVFGTFGEIKALRMPKKMQPGESEHRGFCFVEYYNKGDAKSAFEALCQSTHLYGRRLVLEWAKHDDENELLDTLRKRTAESYNQAAPGGKKSKKALIEPEEMEEDE